MGWAWTRMSHEFHGLAQSPGPRLQILILILPVTANDTLRAFVYKRGPQARYHCQSCLLSATSHVLVAAEAGAARPYVIRNENSFGHQLVILGYWLFLNNF